MLEPYVIFSKAQLGLPSALHVCGLAQCQQRQIPRMIKSSCVHPLLRLKKNKSCPYHTNQDPVITVKIYLSYVSKHVHLFQILQATPADHSKALALSPNASAVAGILVFLEPNGKWQRTVVHSQAPKTHKHHKHHKHDGSLRCFPKSCIRSYSSRIPYCWSKLPISSSCS